MTTDQLIDQREPGFFIVDNEVLEVFGSYIGVYGWAAYGVLAKHANRSGTGAFPSFQTIADLVGMSRPKAIDGVQALVDCGLVIKAPRMIEGRGQTTNSYTLVNVKKLISSGATPPCKPRLQGADDDRSKRGLPPPVNVVDGGSKPRLHDQDPMNKTPLNNSFNNACASGPENGFVSAATLALISGQSDAIVLEPVQAVVGCPPGAVVTPKKKQAVPSVASLAPAPVATPATPAPVAATLYDTLPADDPRMAEHLRLLGMGANPKAERAAKRDAKRAAAGMDLRVNDQGLTESVRAALVTELAVIRRMEALIGPNGHEDHLIKLQAQAERLWRLGVDTPEKMKALGVAWWADNKIVPRGALLEEFQSEILSRMNGGAPAAGEKPNANNQRGRGGHPSGQLAEWKREHGEITAEPIPDRIVKQWHPDDRVAYYTEWRAAYDAAQPAPEWDTEMPDLPKWYADELRAKAAGATPGDAG